ncbi:MAG: Crp/Fnr family transcriptional regulator [Peptostreptococcaceae bacterium]|nr:Crp/Fnr family transcriptional regulator [Peptostreptococcaceae bacterium]
MLNKSLWVVEDKNLQEILMKLKNNIRNFPKGSYIYQQEDVRKYMYFLIEGRVKISIYSPNGSEKTLAIHEPGSFFGETAFFDQMACFCCAEALKDSVVVCLGKQDIRRMMQDNPEIIFHMFDSMGRKIRLLSFQVEYLSFMKIEERLIALLLTLFDSFGVKCSKVNDSVKGCLLKKKCPLGQCLSLSITDQAIGEMIGVRREGVTKAINKLKKRDLVYKQNRVICCPDISILNTLLSELY